MAERPAAARQPLSQDQPGRCVSCSTRRQGLPRPPHGARLTSASAAVRSRRPVHRYVQVAEHRLGRTDVRPARSRDSPTSKNDSSLGHMDGKERLLLTTGRRARTGIAGRYPSARTSAFAAGRVLAGCCLCLGHAGGELSSPAPEAGPGRRREERHFLIEADRWTTLLDRNRVAVKTPKSFTSHALLASCPRVRTRRCMAGLAGNTRGACS